MGKTAKQTDGSWGEEMAARYLRSHGFALLERNYWSPLGELDLVAEKQGIIYFIEVKMRRNKEFGEPIEAITAAKRRRCERAAALLVQRRKWEGRAREFAAIEVIGSPESYELNLILEP